MKIKRLFTMEGESPYGSIEFENRASIIRNPDGSIVSKWDNVSVPKHWSQVATDIIAQKYFRKAGIPKHLKSAKGKGVPDWLQPSLCDQTKTDQEALEADSSSVDTTVFGLGDFLSPLGIAVTPFLEHLHNGLKTISLDDLPFLVRPQFLEAVSRSLTAGQPFLHEGDTISLLPLLTVIVDLVLDHQYSFGKFVYILHPAKFAPVLPGDIVLGVKPCLICSPATGAPPV